MAGRFRVYPCEVASPLLLTGATHGNLPKPPYSSRVTLVLMTWMLSLLLGTFSFAGTPLPAQTAASAANPAMQHDHAPAQLSTTLTVRAGETVITLSPADLRALPQTTVAVFNEHNKQNESFSGPLVSDVLAKAGLALSQTTQRTVLDSYVLATGTDGYFVLFSGAEVQPGLHKAQAVVAIAQDGAPLTRTGAFQLIDSLDTKPARWVRNLSSLTVVPVPTAR